MSIQAAEKQTTSHKGSIKTVQSIGFGIAAFVMGLLSFIPFIGIIFGILAIVFFYVQRKSGVTGLAIAGLSMGIVGLIFQFLLLVIFLIILTQISTQSLSLVSIG
ncbi:MAG TPA: hypothetical protein VK158_04755 [Acidobacteriota bacterium]|nr:hypothetical protein [Acidobacteriota bacterium]